MSQKFVFEELDTVTREYLTGVRDSQGSGAPGVFVPTTSAMAGCGCISGIIVVAVTLILTLTTAVDVIYKEPTRVAFLQTAGLLLGGWLFFAGFRSKTSGDNKNAGHWVYADSLHFYEAYREQVTVTRIDDIVEASYTHNYNNGAYQNSVIRVQLGDGSGVGTTLNNEAKAEQLVVFLNYLAYARGPEGGDRATLAPAQLGGLARYVSEHDAEPKDLDDKIDLGAIDVAFTEVPETPTREGRAAPSFMPYVLLLVAGLVIFFVMKEMVNPPLRDDAIAAAVLTENCEPWFLQVYLLDERNTRHRDEVQRRLAREYDQAIGVVKANQPQNEPLRGGMVQILQSLKETIRPVVSLQVSETGVKAGGEADAKKRADKLRDGLVGRVEGQKASGNSSNDPDYFTATGGIMGEMARLMPPIAPLPGHEPYNPPRTARGIQLIEFASKPDDAPHAHFEIEYQFVPKGDSGKYGLRCKVEIRTNLDGAPVVTETQEAEGEFLELNFDQELEKLRVKLLRGLIGQGNPQGMPGMGLGQPPIIPPNFPQPVVPPPG